MGVLLEIINNPTADDAVNVAESLGWFSMAISYRMQMIRHYDVSIDGKTCRLSSFIESVTRYAFESGGSKHRKAVFGYRGNVEGRIVA